jgi:hypothetical protein
VIVAPVDFSPFATLSAMTPVPPISVIDVGRSVESASDVSEGMLFWSTSRMGVLVVAASPDTATASGHAVADVRNTDVPPTCSAILRAVS